MSAHAFHQLYYDYVWTTKNRVERLTGDTLAWLIHELDVEAHKRGGILLAHNAMPDHVHLLVSLPPTLCVATYIGQVKGAVAHEHNKLYPTAAPIVWQEGYGVISLLKSQSDRAAAYVINQQAIDAARKTRRLLEQTEPV